MIKTEVPFLVKFSAFFHQISALNSYKQQNAGSPGGPHTIYHNPDAPLPVPRDNRVRSRSVAGNTGDNEPGLGAMDFLFHRDGFTRLRHKAGRRIRWRTAPATIGVG